MRKAEGAALYEEEEVGSGKDLGGEPPDLLSLPGTGCPAGEPQDTGCVA